MVSSAVAVLAVAVVAVAAIASIGALRGSDPPRLPAVSSGTATVAERVASELTREIAQHPSWPQRPVQVRDEVVWVPYGPKDPVDYLDWVRGLANRLDRVVPAGAEYVADHPGVPTMAELENAEMEITNILNDSADNAGISWSVGVWPFEGVVLITHTVTQNREFLNDLDRVKRDYGSILKLEAQSEPARPAATTGGAG